MDPNAFIPKQSTPYGPAWMDYIQGSFTSDAAEYALGLVPPITAASVVHDNGCGTGAVTSLIASGSPQPSKIRASDMNPAFTSYVQEKAAKNGWGFVEAAPTDALNLVGFADNTFTHSVNNFVVHLAKDPTKVVSEVYRTVKPSSAGGTAIFTTLAVVVQEEVGRASEVTRGEKVPLRMQGDKEKNTKEWLEKQLKDGGFKSVEVCQKALYVNPDSLEKYCSLMWSMLGAPAAGWTQTDEDHWEEAVGVMVEQIKRRKDVEVKENGGARLTMLSNVAIAKK